MQGKPNPLLSSFRLSYYTLLNLLKRVEGGTDSLEYVIAHSFQQFQQEAARPRVSRLYGVSVSCSSSSLWGLGFDS